MRKKKCKNKECGEMFEPERQLQFVCSPLCALKYNQQHMTKQRRKENKEAKERLKTLTDWLSDAQDACNRYVKLRDEKEPCISCGTRDPYIQYAAGHYRTRGAMPELRFHAEFNIHKQCNSNCNKHRSGNVVEYRINLKKKIGSKNLEWLEGPHKSQNYTIEDAKEIKKYFQEKFKFLKQEREHAL